MTSIMRRKKLSIDLYLHEDKYVSDDIEKCE